MFLVRILQELGRKTGWPLFLCFLDLKKAYDKVDHTFLWQAVARLGVTPQMITVMRNFHDGMKACARSDNDVCSERFEVGQRLQKGLVLYPLLFDIFFAAVLFVASQRFSEDAAILENDVHLQERRKAVGPESSMGDAMRAVWGMLYADDACIVSRSLHGLAKMMAIVVHVCHTFVLTVSEKQTETMCMPASHTPTTTMEVKATWQRYKQAQSFTNLEGSIIKIPNLSTEIARQTRACWLRIRRY